MTYQNGNKEKNRKDWRIRKPSNLPSPVLHGMAQIKMISSFFKLLITVEHNAFGIYNRTRIIKNIATEKELVRLGAASAYLACKKHNVNFTDKQFEEAAQINIDKVKELAKEIEDLEKS